MMIVISFSILSVILAYFSSYKGKTSELLFKFSFFPITFLQMIHYDYGDDYMTYFHAHIMYYNKSFQNFAYLKSIGDGSFKDMGWAVLGHFFPGKVGFFVIVALLSIVENAIYFKLIRDYVEPKHRWKAMVIYLFTTSYYALNFSALRQGLTVAVCVYAVVLSCKDKLKTAVVLVLLMATIHASAIVILPFLFLSRLRLKDGEKIGRIIVWGTIVLFTSRTVVRNLFLAIMEHAAALEKRYGHYVIDMMATDSSVGFGFALNLVMYLTLIFFVFRRFDEFPKKEKKMFILLTCISLMVIPFQLNISGLFSRIGTYFSVFEIVAVPAVYSKIRDKAVRLGVSFIYLFMMLYGYYDFFFITEWSSESYRKFHTIFSAL